MKKLIASLMLVVMVTTSAFAGSGTVTIVSVNKASWTVKTARTVKKTHGAAHAGGAAAGLWLLGPVGALAGYAISKAVTDDDEDQTQGTSETVHGWKVKLSNGEVIKTCTKYKKGQRINRDEIDEE